MAWEERNGKPYYYRKRRIGKRVVSEYIGAGDLAELQAETDQAEREDNKAERTRRTRELAEIDQQLDRLETCANLLIKALALAAGYRPHRGQWRRTKNGPGN